MRSAFRRRSRWRKMNLKAPVAIDLRARAVKVVLARVVVNA